jgi:hypothetical protein
MNFHVMGVLDFQCARADLRYYFVIVDHKNLVSGTPRNASVKNLKILCTHEDVKLAISSAIHVPFLYL